MSYSKLDTPCTRCSGKAQPGTVALMKYTLERFPFAKSLGIYNCRTIAGSTIKSDHSCGRALDVGIPTTASGAAITSLGFQVVKFFDQFSTDFGMVDQIYNRVMYDADSPRGRYYGGVHPHRDHVHGGQTVIASQTLTYAKIVSIAGPSGGNDVETNKFIQTSLRDAGWLGADGKPLVIDGDLGANSLFASVARDKAAKAKVTSTGQTAAQVTAAIAAAIKTHAAVKASGTVHPHSHSEGTTGQPV